MSPRLSRKHLHQPNVKPRYKVISAQRRTANLAQCNGTTVPYNQDHMEERWIATAQQQRGVYGTHRHTAIVLLHRALRESERLSRGFQACMRAGGPGPHSSPPYYLRTKGTTHRRGATIREEQGAPPYVERGSRFAPRRVWCCRVSRPAEVSLWSVDFRSRCVAPMCTKPCSFD